MGDAVQKGRGVPPQLSASGCGASGSCAVKMEAPWHRNLISHQNTLTTQFDLTFNQVKAELWELFPLAAQLFIYLISR